MKVCPDCLSKGADSLVICPHCQADLTRVRITPDAAPEIQPKTRKQLIWAVIFVLGGLALGWMSVDAFGRSSNVGSGGIKGLIIAAILIVLGITRIAR